MNELAERLDKINFLSDKLDGVLIFSSDPNFFYLTNCNLESSAFFYDFKEPKIFTNKMELGKAKLSWIKNIELIKGSSFFKKFKGRICINFNKVSIAAKKQMKFKVIDISKHFEQVRMIKTDYEIKQIRKACAITKEIFGKAEKQISKKITEKELKSLIEYEISKKAELAFPSIVASGSGTAIPHYESQNKKLGKPLLIDIGIKFNGYCSDVTRTYGSIYEKKLMKIIEEIENRLKPGISANSLDVLARKLLGKDRKYFLHGLGHGLGIEVHERPWFGKKFNDILKIGMVVAIELGLYKQTGCRIENDYLITDNGFEKLTDF